MNKILGYVLSGIGILGLASYSVPSIKTALNIPSTVSEMALLGVSLILVLIGIVIVLKSSSGKKLKEVPIYQGKNVVGYRRQK